MAEARGGGGGEKGKKILSFASKKARRVQQKVQPIFIFHNCHTPLIEYLPYFVIYSEARNIHYILMY